TTKAPGADALPPSWMAALNAISPQPAGVATPAALAAMPPSSPAATMHTETLAFDAAFVAGIETQIARIASGGSMVRMQLMPEHLGRIDIEMLAGPNHDRVRLMTEHDTVRDTLVLAQSRLEAELRQNGQRTADVSVELRQQSGGSSGNSAGGPGSGSMQQQRGQNGGDVPGSRDDANRDTRQTRSAEVEAAPGRNRGSVRYA
uniref:flagellar hook-length control protein FliK n=1 Tax=Blastomonas sp. TaxID=1909299 RepID=UPI003593E4EA